MDAHPRRFVLRALGVCLSGWCLIGCEATGDGTSRPESREAEPAVGRPVALVPQVKSQGITYRGIFTLQSTDQNADQSTDQNVEQSKGNGVARFAGIPFAAPPVGKLRWERPQPLVSGVNSIDATQFAPACMQTGSGLAWYHGMMSRVGVDPSLMQAPEYAEDCLYLNVWTDLGQPRRSPYWCLSMAGRIRVVGATSQTIMARRLRARAWWWLRWRIGWGFLAGLVTPICQFKM